MRNFKEYSLFLSKLIFLFCAIFLTSCSIGPKILPQNRQDFNTALLQSEEQQLLMNIVRMQYGDRPYFLGVDNITSNSVLSISSTNLASPGTNYSNLKTNNTTNSNVGYAYTNAFTLAPSITYNDSPTIIYRPLQGTAFTQQMLSPISLQTMYLLIQSGWSIARVLRVTVTAIGDLQNAPSASRPNSKHLPEYQRFVEIAHYLRQLHLNDLIAIEGEKIKGQFFINIIIHKEYQSTPEIQKLFRLLGLPKNCNKIQLTEGETNHKTNAFSVTPRSFLGTLYYVSKSVQVSDTDIKTGVIRVPTYSNGQLFNWNNVTNGMMKIYSSTNRPNDANVSVYYRNRWFYIADNDVDSKETLALLEQLFSLQSAGESSRPPLLTISA
jgi:hypothetical protein